MAEISILLKKETIFAYGEYRKNFNDAARFLVEHHPNFKKACKNYVFKTWVIALIGFYSSPSKITTF
jgi:hypothetical protein